MNNETTILIPMGFDKSKIKIIEDIYVKSDTFYIMAGKDMPYRPAQDDVLKENEILTMELSNLKLKLKEIDKLINPEKYEEDQDEC